MKAKMIFFSLKFNLISTVTKFLFYGAAVQALSTAGTLDHENVGLAIDALRVPPKV